MDLPVLSGVGGLKLTCMKNRRNSLFYTLGLKYKCGLFSTTYTYDRNANLTSMMRKGILDVIHGGVGKLFGLHGYEEMIYSDNKLTAIRVQSDGALYEGRTGVSYNGQSTVAYDANGNLNVDETRNIVRIKYNRQNLPTEITFGDGHRQTITYDGFGRKLRTEYSQVPEGMLVSGMVIYEDKHYKLTSTREYVGPYVFTDGKLEYSAFAGGYFDPDKGAMYYVTDWQGNNVAVVSNTGLVAQRTIYYPYGEPTIEPTGQRYLFGGKEREHAGGRNSYDFGARCLTPYGRWGVVDSESEGFYPFSPYTYCGGDPINYIDPDGKRPKPKDAAILAKHGYGGEDAEKIKKRFEETDWRVSDFKTSIKMNDETGLNSTLYQRKNRDGKTEYAYVFAGTASATDAIEDALQLGGLSEQYKHAIDNARILSKELGDAELTFIGHSLGGGEAAAASMATGRAAITFNPAAITFPTIVLNRLGSPKNVTNYITVGKRIGKHFYLGGDPLNNAQMKSGLKPYGRNIPVETNSIKFSHGINNFLNKNLPDYE